MTVDEFKRKHKITPRKQSVLAPFKDDILRMRDEKITYSDIVLFLEENGLPGQSIQNISRYVLSLENNTSSKETKKIVSESSNDETNSSPKKQFFNVDIKKKVGKSTELEKPDWL